MALTVSSCIPSTIVAGDAVSFYVSDPLYPVTTWATATIYFKNGTNVVRSFSGTVSGGQHLFTLSNANTATLFPGRNLVSVSYSDGTYRGSTAWREINVLPDPTTASVASAAETILAAIDAAMLTLSSSANVSVSVDGVSYTKRDSGSLQALRNYWYSIVLRERAEADALRGICRTRVMTVFGGVGCC